MRSQMAKTASPKMPSYRHDGDCRARHRRSRGHRFTTADLTQRPGQGPERGSDNGGADQVEPARLVLVIGRVNPKHGDRGDGDGRVDPKHRLPAECLGQPAAQHRAGRGGQCRGGGPYADRRVAFLLWISRADQGQTRRRQQRRADALQDSRGNEPRRGRRQGATDRRRSKQQTADRQYARLAVSVGQRAADQGQ